jgi:hypothetical protein
VKLTIGLFLVLSTSLFGGEIALPIQVVETKVVPGPPGGAVLGQAQCDDRENVFFRQVTPGPGRAVLFMRVDSDARGSFSFDLNSARTGDDRTQSAEIRDFAVVGSMVYLLMPAANDKARVLKFSTDGQFRSEVVLDTAMTPRRLGVMPAGELLLFGTTVSGRRDPADPSSFHFDPAVEVYGSSGQFLKRAGPIMADVDLNAKGTDPAERSLPVDLAVAATGADGFYLLTYSQKPALYVMSPAAEVVRNLELWTPGQDFRPLAMRVNGRQVLVEFVKATDEKGNVTATVLAVYDGYTGEHTFTYTADDAGVILGCSDWRGGFTFLGGDSRNRRTVKYATVGGH